MDNVNPSTTGIQKTFESASQYLTTSPSASSISSQTKLQLYALYKLATVPTLPSPSSRPAIWELTNRAKFDAVIGLASSDKFVGLEVEERHKKAMEGYIDQARRLGWSDGTGGSRSEEVGVQEGLKEEQKERGGMRNVSLMRAEEIGSHDTSMSPLHELAVNDDRVQLEEYLERLQKSGDLDEINRVDEFGFTPLHLGADRGHLEAVRLLLKGGADKTIKDSEGFTALDLATEGEHLDIVALLR